ncbi:MAG: TIGR03987 family protein, partial [Anaerolineales bacterium]
GLLAIILMLIHSVWATVVLVKKDEKMIVNFHRFSVFVWLVWLVPYFSPMIIGIAGV